MTTPEQPDDIQAPQRIVREVSPDLLTVHPLARSLPMLHLESAEWGALFEDIRARQIDQPILVDESDQVLDGRHRLAVAKKLKLQTVPVLTVVSAETMLAEEVILGAIMHRRNLGDSARLYLAYPFFAVVLQKSRDNRLAKLKSGGKNCVPSNETAGALADKYGVGRNLVFEAAKVHRIFNQAADARSKWMREHPVPDKETSKQAPPDLRAEWEPKILSGDIGLGGAVAGIAGQATKGKKRPKERPPIEFFRGAQAALSQHAVRRWSKMDEESRTEFLVKVRSDAATWPDDFLAAYQKALTTTAKHREKEGA